MEQFLEVLLGVIIIGIGPVLTLLGFSGNTLMLIASVWFAYADETRFFDFHLMIAMMLVYVIGELWEFLVSYFGIRKKKLPWGAVILIAIGTFIGAVVGTGFLPIFGSVIGGAIGSFLTAYIYEYCKTSNSENAFSLAYQAAKMQFLAVLGKLVAAIVMAILLVKQLFLGF